MNKTRLKVLHININLCQVAQHILAKTVREIIIDIAMAKINGVAYYRCYAPPSLKLDKLNEFLDRIINYVKFHKSTVISDDFNATTIKLLLFSMLFSSNQHFVEVKPSLQWILLLLVTISVSNL